MDVIVQHHPEYVALAWGAMKFLFKVSDPKMHALMLEEMIVVRRSSTMRRLSLR